MEEGEESTVNSLNSIYQKTLKKSQTIEVDPPVETASKIIEKPKGKFFQPNLSISVESSDPVIVGNSKSAATDVENYRSVSIDDHETVQEDKSSRKSIRTFSQYVNPMEKYNEYDDESDVKSSDANPMLPQVFTQLFTFLPHYRSTLIRKTPYQMNPFQLQPLQQPLVRLVILFLPLAVE